MTERFDEQARRAADAVRERTGDLDRRAGLDDVVRRGRRPRTSTGLAVLLVLLLAVPAVAWVRGLTQTEVQLQPAGTPTEALTPSPSPSPTPSPRPTEPHDDEHQPKVAPPGSEEMPEDEDAPVPTPSPSPDQGSSPGPEPAGEYGTAEVTANDFPFGGGEVAMLTDVRVARQDGFERVVLELDGRDVPSYRVGYVDPPIIQDGSGDEIRVEGRAFLELRLAPAAGYDSRDAEWFPTYTGPDRVTGDTEMITEVVRTGDYEANLAWVVGLPSERPFAVTVLRDPMRLVVDIAAP